MRKYLIFFILFLFNTILYALDLNSLDKYKWIEQVPQTKGQTTKFERLEEIPIGYEIYKMKYYQQGNSWPKFFVFYYNATDDKYYDVTDFSYKRSKIPLLSFNELESYIKINGNDNILEGEYYCENEKIFHFEIKKVEKKNYLYAVFLSYEELGAHLLYLENNILKSDNTFGSCNENTLEELFSVDRSESYYNYRNILSTYSNDNFTIAIKKNEEFNIELELKSDIRTIKIFPQPLYIDKYIYVDKYVYPYQNAKIYDDNGNFLRKQQKFNEEVLIIDRKNEWIEINGVLTLFVKIQFPDKTTGWICSNDFRIY